MVKRKVIHLNRMVEFKDRSVYNGTLCGKQQWQGGLASEGGGVNCTTNPKEVTCKLCLKMLKNKEVSSHSSQS